MDITKSFELFTVPRIEQFIVELFAENILEAGVHFLERSSDAPFIPTWNRVFSAMPDIFDELIAAVESDHEEFSAAPELPKVARG